MAFGKNDLTLAVLYIMALLGLAAFQLWSLSAAIVGAVIVFMAATITEKASTEKKLGSVRSDMEERHRVLNEKVGQQLLFFAGEIESLKAAFNKSLYAVESRLGMLEGLDSKYSSLVEKILQIENRIGELKLALAPEPARPVAGSDEEVY